ncbi:DUF6094 domain-containing protein [Rummeliibacillus stabekisii]|uniref:DUF6094 domain-containing protein n=1 Tax=Rummeliibacillus stabekisii TaxID=241244 RepID=UPI0032E7F5E7
MMSQIGNKLLAGFYQTPERQGEYIKNLLNFKGDTAALDTTCGEGEILAQITSDRDSVNVVTYGVELEKGRAEAASSNLQHAIHAPIESMIISNDAFGLVFLNPPYDNTMRGYDEDSTDRKEYIELVRGTRYVKPDGIVIYIIPSYRFADPKIARHLATQFTDCKVARFTDEDYPNYKQCVFIGRKKSDKFKRFVLELYTQFLNFDNEDFVMKSVPTLEDLLNRELKWDVPTGTTNIPTFYSRIEDKNKFVELIAENKGFLAFKERTKPKVLDLTNSKPIIPITQGEMALLLASGAVNGVLSSGNSLHAVQGIEVVSKIVTEEETEHTLITKTRTKREVSVKVITPSGKVKKFM